LFPSIGFASSSSQAALVIHTCSCPQAGQFIRAAILGKLRKTADSISIWVETATPELGHLIITELI
jgi:hypothetical protein